MSLAADCNVHVVKMDQCIYGLLTRGPGNVPTPAMKPTKWMTSSIHMAKRLSKTCANSHTHQALEGGRPAAAAFYPAQLIIQLRRGTRDTAEAEGHLQNAIAWQHEGEVHHVQEEEEQRLAEEQRSADNPRHLSSKFGQAGATPM